MIRKTWWIRGTRVITDQEDLVDQRDEGDREDLVDQGDEGDEDLVDQGKEGD